MATRQVGVHRIDPRPAAPTAGSGVAGPPAWDGERAQLLELRRFRREQLAALRRGDADTARPGPAADEVLATLRTGAEQALAGIEAALRRIRDGRYGRCTACGAPLEPARLEVLPQVSHCLPCERHR